MKFELGQITDHTITIKASHNKGFTVRVGCSEFVFSNAGDLLLALKNYLDSPKTWEVVYAKTREGKRDESQHEDDGKGVRDPTEDPTELLLHA